MDHAVLYHLYQLWISIASFGLGNKAKISTYHLYQSVLYHAGLNPLPFSSIFSIIPHALFFSTLSPPQYNHRHDWFLEVI